MSLQEDLTSWLVIKHDSEPIFNTAVDDKRGHLDFGESNSITSGHILIPASESQFVCGTLNLQLEFMVPDGFLSTLVMDWCLVLLALESNCDVWGHLSKCFSVVGKLSFRNFQCKNSFVEIHFVLGLFNFY